MKEPTLERLEQDIELTLAFLLCPLDLKNWSYYIRQYNYLIIKYLHGKGEPIITDNSKHKNYYDND